jgi:hypothetical protein
MFPALARPDSVQESTGTPDESSLVAAIAGLQNGQLAGRTEPRGNDLVEWSGTADYLVQTMASPRQLDEAMCRDPVAGALSISPGVPFDQALVDGL